MQLAGKHLKLFQKIQQLGDAAILSPLRHQQVMSAPHLGTLTYDNIQDLAEQARRELIELKMPVNPKNLRDAAQGIIETNRTMIQDMDVGPLVDFE
jgi:hypothetical protein